MYGHTQRRSIGARWCKSQLSSCLQEVSSLDPDLRMAVIQKRDGPVSVGRVKCVPRSEQGC